jgi:hypothetical protein
MSKTILNKNPAKSADLGEETLKAIEALREKAEREKGCDWCQQKHNRYLFTQIADLNAETPIACPWCGKRLEVGHETD